ncbi:MAG: hypothetical protein VX296_03425, partial [Pseudomonadota bacterium]|nr:hypothetical protein [Pseudomonadota bacterium]
PECNQCSEPFAGAACDECAVGFVGDRCESELSCLDEGLCMGGNRMCAGAFEFCVAPYGECQPVPCQGDDDCTLVGRCDRPDGTGTGRIICDQETRQCVRDRSGGLV